MHRLTALKAHQQEEEERARRAAELRLRAAEEEGYADEYVVVRVMICRGKGYDM